MTCKGRRLYCHLLKEPRGLSTSSLNPDNICLVYPASIDFKDIYIDIF